jgi:adenosine kinase
MNFSGLFGDFILPEKIHTLNISFHVDSLEEKRGGTGGNIAYGLALMGESATILACVGKDFGPYKTYLKKIGVQVTGLRTLTDELTAGAYITTDRQGNQLTTFHEAAMSRPCEYSFAGLDPQKDIAIIAPTLTEDMVRHALFYKQKKLRYIFDPGQQLSTMTARDLTDGITGAELLVSNGYELDLICRITDLDLPGILELTPVVITTFGHKGSRIARSDGSLVQIPATPITTTALAAPSASTIAGGSGGPGETALNPEGLSDIILDPTGAGDAYRAGLLKGLLEGMSLEHSACLGSVCAAFCVEKHGTQEYYFDQVMLAERLANAYNLHLPFTFNSNICPAAKDC